MFTEKNKLQKPWGMYLLILTLFFISAGSKKKRENEKKLVIFYVWLLLKVVYSSGLSCLVITAKPEGKKKQTNNQDF